MDQQLPLRSSASCPQLAADIIDGKPVHHADLVRLAQAYLAARITVTNLNHELKLRAQPRGRPAT